MNSNLLRPLSLCVCVPLQIDEHSEELVVLSSRVGKGAVERSGKRAVLQCAVVLNATLPTRLAVPRAVPASGEAPSGDPVAALCALIITGGTDGTLFVWDPETDPDTSEPH